MKTKFIISILTILISFFSCKEKTLEKKQVVEKISIVKKIDTIKAKSIESPNIQIQEEFSKSILKKIDIMKHSEYFEPNGGGKYKKNEKTLFLEIVEEMKTHEKYIGHITVYDDNDDNRNSSTFSYFINKENQISLVILHSYKKISLEKKRVDIKKDTFFFKNNKIYFCKNRELNKEELLKKEKEILIVKKEIDSLMERQK